MDTKTIVFDYHERTKHHPDRYAASLGYMDWATQPDPFRRYEDAERIALPLTLENPTPAYGMLFGDVTFPPAPLSLESVSQLLQFSLGLAAWKSIGTDRWALRCNASSGNLHPTEATLILPPVEGISERSVVAHYAPKEHALEILASFDTDFWQSLPKGSLLLGIGSVLWREVWKYGERAFRYTQLDAGHARRAVEVSARLAFWQTRRIDVAVGDLDRLMGLNQKERYLSEEKEIADMLLLCSPSDVERVDLSSLLAALPERFEGTANRLSPSHHYWEAIDMIEKATHVDPLALPLQTLQPVHGPRSNMEAKTVILTRRSAQAMDFARAAITKEAFLILMRSITPSLDGCAPAANLALFLHHVEGLPSGLYLLLRNRDHFDFLRTNTRDAFVWEEVEPGLYLLEKGDFRSQAKFISCSQDIAADGAFSLGMLCEFAPQIEAYGAQRYKELFFECGALGQQLYLEATSLGLSATGIGCFLDDVMHRLLGLPDDRFQSLYHFTVGRAIVDMRLTTLPPYFHLTRTS
jgi:SagB-type dehydrogenase family enzyme